MKLLYYVYIEYGGIETSIFQNLENFVLFAHMSIDTLGYFIYIHFTPKLCLYIKNLAALLCN